MEIGAAPRYSLFNTVDNEARHIEAIFNVHVSTRQAIQDAEEPQQQSATSALGTPYYRRRAVKYAGTHHAVDDETSGREEA